MKSIYNQVNPIKIANKQFKLIQSLLMFLFAFSTLSSFAQLPNFDVDDCDGQNHNLYDDLAAGKTVVLNFCAGWCQPCREADVILEDVYQRSCAGQADVLVYGMLFEDFSVNPADCVFGDLYSSTFGLNFPMITDMGTPGNEIHYEYFNTYGTVGIPVFFIIEPNVLDPANSVVNVIEGNSETLFDDIVAFLPPNSILEIEMSGELCTDQAFEAELSSSFSSGNSWSTTEVTNTITVTNSGMYYLTNSLGCGTDSIDIQFLSPPAVGVVSTLETELCEGVEYIINYTGGSGTDSYWEFFDSFSDEWILFDFAVPGDFILNKTYYEFDVLRVREENNSTSTNCPSFSNEIQVALIMPGGNESITAPEDLITPVDSNCETNLLDLGEPTFNSTCGNISDLGNDAPLSFPVGQTLVTWYATVDGAFVTDFQIVTVIDPEVPTITAPDDLVVETDLNAAIGIDFGSPIVSDNCGIYDIINDNPGIYPIGITTLTWTVYDLSGNYAEDVQTITVNQVPLCPTAKYYIPLYTDFGPIILTCFDPPAGYELADQTCAEEIALNDSYCTDVIWDEICLQAYNICLYGCENPGCTDENSCSYDPDALCNNGICDYPDSDGDLIVDCYDPCPLIANAEPDDACDDSNPFTTQDQLQFDCTCLGIPDSDADGISDDDEINVYFTNPLLADSDGDGITDKIELEVTFSNPNLADTDADGCNDLLEYANLCPDSPVCGENACPSDSNSDGLINTADLNAVLASFGGVCP